MSYLDLGRGVALALIVVGAGVLAACVEDTSDGAGGSLKTLAGEKINRQTRGVTSPGNCGGSATNGEDTCVGRGDGIYCSTLRDFSAIECKDGQIVSGHQCDTGSKCIGPDGPGTSIQCGADDDPTDDGAPEQNLKSPGGSSRFHAVTDELNKYGQECEAEVGLMPKFDCMDFPEIPTLQDGKPLSVVDKGGALVLQRDGKAIPGKLVDEEITNPDGSKTTIKDQWAPRPTCDNPSWASTPCYPGTRVGLIKSGGASWAILCRRQAVQKSTEPYFQLIGVIAHNKGSGATCFFDKIGNVTLTKANFAAPGAADKKTQTAALRIWAEPGESFENCMQCHSTGAFIRSPYVATVPLKAEMGNTFHIVGKKFKELWMRDKKDGAAEDAPRTLELDDGSCQGCHRLATSLQSRMFAHLAVGGPEIDNKSSDTRLAAIAGTETRWPAGFWMPPDGRKEKSLADWTASYGSEQKTVEQCAIDPSSKGCTVSPFAYFK